MSYIYSFTAQCERCPDTAESIYQPDANFGAINEKIESLIDSHANFKRKKNKKEFQDVIKLRVMQSMCAAGEPVGLLAAQVGRIIKIYPKLSLKYRF